MQSNRSPMNKNEICYKCSQLIAERMCKDCIPPNNKFCYECFKGDHKGKSSQNHTFLCLKVNAIVVDKFPSHDLSPNDYPQPLPNFLLHNNNNNNNIITFTDQTDILKSESTLKNINQQIDELTNKKQQIKIENSQSIDYSLIEDQSIINENQCALFESGIIKQFQSIKNLAESLKITESEESLRIRIVTIISKPINNESLANQLLLKNNQIKFIEGANKIQSPMCFMVYDTENQLLVLETQNIHKINEKYFDDQNKLLKLILALSDIIIISENQKRISDFIRIHEIMKICKSRYGSHYSKVDKRNPQLLAPAIIYLLLKDPMIKDDLPTHIKDKTDRKDLFASFTEIIPFDINQNDDKLFFEGLKKISENVSKYRNRHSLADIIECIDKCQESSSIKEDISSNDIPFAWFLCGTKCETCLEKCTKSFNHNNCHYNDNECISSYGNEVYFCKKCCNKKPLVLQPMSKNEGFLKNILSYPFRRGIVECEEHGIIDDRNWLISYYPDKTYSRHLHKWPGENLMSQNVYPVSQILIDKVKEIAEPASKIVMQSTEYISDSVRPVDWQPNRGTSNCTNCNQEFTITMSKHHCRACKMVICSVCCSSNSSLPICQKCSDNNLISDCTDESKAITFINMFRDTYNTSSQFIKKTVVSFHRPDYWEDDEKAIRCFGCEKEFHNENNPIHHCRACGKCVCDNCSQERRPVEWRYIHDQSRVCDECIKNYHWRKH